MLTIASLLLTVGSVAVAEPLAHERDQVLSRKGNVIPYPQGGVLGGKPGPGRVDARLVSDFDGQGRFIRVAVALLAPPQSEQWHVEIRTASGQLLTTIRNPPAPGPEWEEDPAPARQELVLFSDEFAPQPAVMLSLHADAPDAAPRMRIAFLTLETVPSHGLSIPDGDNALQPITANGIPGSVVQWGASVGRLRFGATNGVVYYCTSFLVAQDLIMTNYHCIQYADELVNARVEFGADKLGAPVIERSLAGLAKRSRALDLAIYRLNTPVAATPLQLSAEIMPEPSLPPPELAMIQHPKGELKQVSLKGCHATDASMTGTDPAKGNTDFGHNCDTFTGSSGAPVQDLITGRVVGLHHLGIEGGVLVNRAVHTRLVLDFLREQAPSVFDRVAHD